MTIPSWPSTLPQEFLSDDFSRGPAQGPMRTDMEYGPAKSRRRSSAVPQSVSASIAVTSTQLGYFKTFYHTTLSDGSLRFSHKDPDNGTTAIELRFTGPYSYGSLGGVMWQISLPLEILP